MISNDRRNEKKSTTKSKEDQNRVCRIRKSARKACKRGLTGNVKKGRQGDEGGDAPPFNVGLRSARMETRANSITPPDSILLGSSALVERVALAANTP